ncbi:Uncharacterized conserved protein, contains FIST_N domain [Persephonella hydrogeniphila]|uniref:Uncharacterized conserved protein, contains FIST_N domain n=1 Tax=Persephonella hydrogeniphila TaxID=198703 RepID=A0A285NPS3_9AQUI|nr:FIST N-terminal domain-containing protein [Persephonella hydrogeniphila]SNZ11218.1 Uncharacterized conserved protein, contains FIST_N domain [Persephonella hydrogeniphila]
MEVKGFQGTDSSKVIRYIREIEENFKPDLFIIFMPYYHFENESLEKINSGLNTPHIIISSVATIKDKYILYDSIGGVAIKFKKKGYFDIKSLDFISKDISASSLFLKEHLISEKEGTNLLFSTSSNLAVHKILNSILNFYTDKVRLYGGIASSDASDFRTYISVNGKIIKDGFVLLNLYNINSFNTISLGFIPVGTTYRVTKVKDNKIYALDDLPMDYFLGNILKNTGIQIEDLDITKTSQVLWEFPFLFYDKEGYISHLLVPMMYDKEDKGFAFYGEVQEGSLIKLSTGDSDDILQDVQIRAGEFLKIINETGRKPDLIMNISCTARNFLLYSDGASKKEQEIYSSKIGNFPFTGFLTFGEIGPDRMGKPGKFYNETSILVGLVER